MSRIFIGLVHYPIYNKNMQEITTSVTNLDIHDIARCAATYGLTKYYIIHPLVSQHDLVNEVLDYWQKGYGSVYNPDRKQALLKVELQDSIDSAKRNIEKDFPGRTYTIVTDARVYPKSVGYDELRNIIEENTVNIDNTESNFFILFGTGWGLTKEIIENADYVLKPVWGRGNYNHLSVRSAVAIILDRLLGQKWW